MAVADLVPPLAYQVQSTLHDLKGLVPMGPAMPDVSAIEPPGAAGFETLLGWSKWVSLAICVLGLISAGAVMAFQSRRGDGAEHLGRIGMALIGVVIISAASSLVSLLA